jgi:hypothetical protein
MEPFIRLQRPDILDNSTHLTEFKVVLWYNKLDPWRIGLKSYLLMCDEEPNGLNILCQLMYAENGELTQVIPKLIRGNILG